MTAPANLIEQQWQDFASLYRVAGAGPTQVRECRRAFYAGAVSLFRLLLEVSDDGSKEPTETNLALLNDINAEFQRYADDLENGRA